MINLEDIYDMTCLSRDEIAAIGEHEHLDGIGMAAKAEYLMHLPKGPQAVQRMICDDIRQALHTGNLPHARELFVTLRHFMADHPEAARGAN